MPIPLLPADSPQKTRLSGPCVPVVCTSLTALTPWIDLRCGRATASLWQITDWESKIMQYQLAEETQPVSLDGLMMLQKKMQNERQRAFRREVVEPDPI